MAPGEFIILGIIVYLLWIRPEYMFVLFYVVANALLVFVLIDVWTLTWADAAEYALWTGISIAVNVAAGVVIVTLFKWLKTRKTGRDKQLDKEMERIRADIGARESQQ